MLSVSAKQGIAQMAATPHFYPSENTPEQFLDQRKHAAERLRNEWKPEFPKLLLGAEVYYFEGMSRVKELESLRIEGTSLLLLEMPFHAWPGRMVAEVKALHDRPGFTVLLAHIERYLSFQKNAVWDELLEAGVMMQSNATFFLHWSSRRKAIHMLEAGHIHLLGSDCHNMKMKERAPRMGEAMKVIGAERCRALECRCQAVLEPEEAVV